ncbi:MAG: type II toxin-antitoxin system VapC family toxin [Pseudomonadota bacterium]
MKRCLVDTNVLIKMLEAPSSVSAFHRATLRRPGMTFHVSTASYWEIEIKRTIGKLNVAAADVRTFCTEQGWREHPVDADIAIAAGQLPAHHGDPFDRAIIATAQILRLPVMTSDHAFANYGIETI